VPAQRRNGGSELPSDRPPAGDDVSQRDTFFLEELSYRGHLSSDELIAFGVSHGLRATEVNDWINDAASRGIIEPLELGAGVDTRWRIAL
jgi:hypothetical protein